MAEVEGPATRAEVAEIIAVRLHLETHLDRVLVFHPREIVQQRERSEVIVRGDVVTVTRVPLRELDRREQVILQSFDAELASIRLHPTLVVTLGEVGVAEARKAGADVVQQRWADRPVVIDAHQAGSHPLSIVILQSRRAAHRKQARRRGALHRRAIGEIEHAAQTMVRLESMVDFEAAGPLIGRGAA